MSFVSPAARRSMVVMAVAGAIGLVMQPSSPYAQGTVTPLGQPQAALAPPQVAPSAATPFSQAQLESMLAPIALYPDQLLGQMLMAATYSQEVMDADRWLHDAANAGLSGDAMTAALAPVDWDPSVKSLVPFPQVLDTMAQHPDWTQALGEAFVAQQAEVMDVVQGLRRAAWADGTLRPTPQLAVASEGGTIVIEPANPGMLYVPIYDPTVVYGAWSYPQPPVAIYPPERYVAPIVFAAGFAIVRPLWGWSRWDWSRHSVAVDPPRVNAINARLIEEGHRQRIAESTWRFDPSHGRTRPGPAPHATAAVAPHRLPHSEPAHASPGSHGAHRSVAAVPHAAPAHHGNMHPASVRHAPPTHAAPAAHAPAHAGPSHAAGRPSAPHGQEHGHGDEHQHH